MPAVDTEDVFEVAPSGDEVPVEAVGAQRAHSAFGVGVRVRRLNRRADHLDSPRAEDLVEGVAEFRVAVVHEEPAGTSLRTLRAIGRCLFGCLASVGAGRERRRAAVSPRLSSPDFRAATAAGGTTPRHCSASNAMRPSSYPCACPSICSTIHTSASTSSMPRARAISAASSLRAWR
jgi:hypothetical protein